MRSKAFFERLCSLNWERAFLRQLVQSLTFVFVPSIRSRTVFRLGLKSLFDLLLACETLFPTKTPLLQILQTCPMTCNITTTERKLKALTIS